MAANDAIKLAILAGVHAANTKKQVRKPSGDPAINIAMLAYWDGVCNLASGFMDVLDDKQDVDGAMDSIMEFADRLADVMRDALEEDE